VIQKAEYIVQKSDYVTGALAASSPWWLRYLEDYAAAYIAIGGAILVTIRVAIAYRDWRRNKGD
jgi:hypothetical protein